MEFQMPLDGNTGFQGDTPAIWMLNAQIPRTLQYGEETCSCWASGCGELDIVEVLSPGLIQCKSTIHTNMPAGDSDYITRPTNSPMKLAVIFRSTSSTAHIQVLSENFDFESSLTSAQIEDIYTSTQGSLLSVFDVTAWRTPPISRLMVTFSFESWQTAANAEVMVLPCFPKL